MHSQLIDIEKVFSAKFKKSIDESFYLKISKTKIIFYYKFDVIVFLDFRKDEIDHQLELLSVGEKEKNIFQDYYVSFDPKTIPSVKEFVISDELVNIKENTLEYLEIISLLLAHSVALEHYESEIDTLLENTKFYNPESSNIKEKEVLWLGSKILTMKHQIVSDLYLLDKPDIIWDDITLENFYESLYKFYDLNSRFHSLEYKLNTMTENVTFLHEILNYKKSHFLERIIIYLIVFEIAYTLADHFFL